MKRHPAGYVYRVRKGRGSQSLGHGRNGPVVIVKAAIAVELLPFYEAEAKERMIAGVKVDPRAKLPQGDKGQARDHAAKAVGVSPAITKEVVDMSKIKLTTSRCPKCGAVHKAETKKLGSSSTQQKTKNKPIVFVICQSCLDAITPIGSQADASTRA